MKPTPPNGKNKKPSTAIIYQSPTQDVFILDIPRSLELAQHPSSPFSQGNEHGNNEYHGRSPSLLSCAPLKAPYPSPPEPKTEKARKRVLGRIPGPEKVFHDGVVSVVGDALRYLKDRGYDGDGDGVWCFEREVSVDVDDDVKRSRRKRKHEETIPSNQVQTSMSTSTSIPNAFDQPPIILSPGINHFPDLPSIYGSIVKNLSPTHPAILHLSSSQQISIPPNSTFLLAHFTPPPHSQLRNTSFDLLLLDPPWPNRSVRRSSHYHTTPSFSSLETLLTNLLQTHLRTNPNPNYGGIAGIWTTNTHKARQTVRAAFAATQLHVFEEWIWVKCTDRGEPVVPLEGVWRRPYEVLMWGRRCRQEGSGKGEGVRRRVVFGVPDVHSRKPGLRELVEKVFFPGLKEYTAMEVFARSLTAGWSAVGDEVIKFNHAEWWKDT